MKWKVLNLFTMIKKALLSNYPPDVRNYDSDPRSPFYNEPDYVCLQCNRAFEESEMANECLCIDCFKED